MFARVLSGGLLGIDAYRIEVEVDCSGGIGQMQIVGLPDAAVREAQERVRTAIKTCSFLMPTAKKWIINLAPQIHARKVLLMICLLRLVFWQPVGFYRRHI